MKTVVCPRFFFRVAGSWLRRVVAFMPRHARIRVAGLPLHIWQRGNNRGACFTDQQDRLLLLGLMNEFGATKDCALHAYVLMTNHFHLLLTPERREGASEFMKGIEQHYSQHVNRKYRRSGTLWEGRFKSSLVLGDEYLWRCHRYIELNPVRAGMVRNPGDYPWSSHNSNAFGQPSLFLRPCPQYTALAKAEAERRSAYRNLFDVPLEHREIDEIRTALVGGFALGSRTAIESLERELGSRIVSGGKGGRPRKKIDDAA